ncbi:hypothetical protein GT50_01570 [Geobacillus stearothermophilus 10]|nr:hypothetical protein GT50_01570 [Geobacillus stearothermophilus 10]
MGGEASKRAAVRFFEIVFSVWKEAVARLRSLEEEGKGMRQAASIACIGGANVDRKARLLTPFRLGTSHPVTTTQTAGGVARNIAENLGRLAQPVSLVSTVGDDRDGQWLVDVTSRYVNTSFIVRTPKANTGTYTAVLDERGEMVLALADMAIYHPEPRRPPLPRVSVSGG